MSELEIGRGPISATQPTVFDAPNAAVKAVITKLDQVIDKLNALTEAVETATDAATLFTALDVTSFKAAVEKLRFTL